MKKTLAALLCLILLFSQALAQEEAPVEIAFSADGVQTADERVFISGDTVTINYAGTYVLSGIAENKQVVVTTHKDTSVELVLDNLTLSCSFGPAILANTDMLTLTAAPGTQNMLRDNDDRKQPTDGSPAATVHASDDMTVGGTGALKVIALLGNALHCKDDLTVRDLTLDVEAANDGLRGNDGVSVESGDITIVAKGDGIQSSNSDSGKGHVTIEGGTLHIVADKDGIQAASILQINGGSLTIRQGLGK